MENKTKYMPEKIADLKKEIEHGLDRIADPSEGERNIRAIQGLLLMKIGGLCTEIERLQAESRTAREEALEEVARLCDGERMFGEGGHMQSMAERRWRKVVAESLAKEIRELKHKETTHA